MITTQKPNKSCLDEVIRGQNAWNTAEGGIRGEVLSLDDVNKEYARLSSEKRPSWFRRYGAWVLGGIAALATAGLIYFSSQEPEKIETIVEKEVPVEVIVPGPERIVEKTVNEKSEAELELANAGLDSKDIDTLCNNAAVYNDLTVHCQSKKGERVFYPEEIKITGQKPGLQDAQLIPILTEQYEPVILRFAELKQINKFLDVWSYAQYLEALFPDLEKVKCDKNIRADDQLVLGAKKEDETIMLIGGCLKSRRAMLMAHEQLTEYANEGLLKANALIAALVYSNSSRYPEESEFIRRVELLSSRQVKNIIKPYEHRDPTLEFNQFIIHLLFDIVIERNHSGVKNEMLNLLEYCSKQIEDRIEIIGADDEKRDYAPEYYPFARLVSWDWIPSSNDHALDHGCSDDSYREIIENAEKLSDNALQSYLKILRRFAPSHNILHALDKFIETVTEQDTSPRIYSRWGMDDKLNSIIVGLESFRDPTLVLWALNKFKEIYSTKVEDFEGDDLSRVVRFAELIKHKCVLDRFKEYCIELGSCAECMPKQCKEFINQVSQVRTDSFDLSAEIADPEFPYNHGLCTK